MSKVVASVFFWLLFVLFLYALFRPSVGPVGDMAYSSECLEVFGRIGDEGLRHRLSQYLERHCGMATGKMH